MRLFDLEILSKECLRINDSFRTDFRIFRICSKPSNQWASYIFHGKWRMHYFLCLFRNRYPLVQPIVLMSELPFIAPEGFLVVPAAPAMQAAFNEWSGYYSIAVALAIIQHSLLQEQDTPPTVKLTAIHLHDKIVSVTVTPFDIGNALRLAPTLYPTMALGQRLSVETRNER